VSGTDIEADNLTRTPTLPDFWRGWRALGRYFRHCGRAVANATLGPMLSHESHDGLGGLNQESAFGTGRLVFSRTIGSRSGGGKALRLQVSRHRFARELRRCSTRQFGVAGAGLVRVMRLASRQGGDSCLVEKVPN